jgi:hypothetical protein
MKTIRKTETHPKLSGEQVIIKKLEDANQMLKKVDLSKIFVK